jgi:hypothetical protein
VSLLRRAFRAIKAELKVALKTFGAAWAVLTVALTALTVMNETHGMHDVVAMLTLGVVICAGLTFWPALAVAACRSAYRVLGLGAYVGALLIVAGVLGSLVLFRNELFSMGLGIFEAASFSGPCGGHAGGAAAVLSLFCFAFAVLGSPGSWWALFMLCLATSGAILLGAIPGVLLWAALLARKLYQLRKRA